MLRLSDSRKKSTTPAIQRVFLPAPTDGINTLVPPTELGPREASNLIDVTCLTNGIAQRPALGYHITSNFANPVYALHQYAAVGGTNTLWATTDTGVFDVTSSGAAPGVTIALTNGKTIGAVLSTGAQNYLTLVNGTDSMVQYDGATWAAVATVGGGAINTNTFSYVETYRQRLYFVVENTTRLVYLTANSPTAGGTTYDTAAIFRRGGYILALATWTIDGGTGPDDHLCVLTSQGEIAVFVGNDPATWTYKGTYFVGLPVGKRPMIKMGGDMLYLGENGIYPLSKALLVATIDRSAAVTAKINNLFVIGVSGFNREAWETCATIDTKNSLLIVNTLYFVFVMNTQTGAWSSWYLGTPANHLLYSDGTVYIASNTLNRVAKLIYSLGVDYGSTPVPVRISAGQRALGNGRPWKIVAIQPQIGLFGSSLGYPTGGASIVVLRSFNSGATITAGTTPVKLKSSAYTNEAWLAAADNYSLWKELYITCGGDSLANFLTYTGCFVAFTVGSQYQAPS